MVILPKFLDGLLNHTMVQPVADKFNPLSQRLNPIAGTEGARVGGTGRATYSPSERITTDRGTISYAVRSDGRLYINEVVTKPGFRREGVATQLVKKALQETGLSPESIYCELFSTTSCKIATIFSSVEST